MDFKVANETKGAMVKILLDKLKGKDIIFGKIENITKADNKKFLS